MEHSFDIDIAVEHGVDGAIILRHLAYCIMTNRATDEKSAQKRHTHYGKTWTYQSTYAFTRIYPYWTQRQVRTLLARLIKEGVIIRNRFPGGYSQTSWYAFADENQFDRIVKSVALANLTRNGPKQSDRTVKSIRPKSQINRPNGQIDDRKSQTTNTSPIPTLSLGLKNNCADVFGLDLKIVEKRKFFTGQISEIFHPNQNEATTFSRIARHLVKRVQTGAADISIFNDAVEWARAAKAKDVVNPKGLFVAVIKEMTGFKAQKMLLRNKS